MKGHLTYYYSACVGIQLDKLSILCDPWFTDGAYYGSWYQYPKLSCPLQTVGEYDYIFISHIHDDHLDLTFLRQYLDKFPSTRVLVADRKYNYMASILSRQQIPYNKISAMEIHGYRISILPYKDSVKWELDSALEILHINTGQKILNLNDIPYDEDFLDAMAIRSGKLLGLLAGYTGAGPYPQTYYSENDPELLVKAQQKKESFLLNFQKTCQILRPLWVLPFAGKYYLGGKNINLNDCRGVADALETKSLYDNVIVPVDGGLGVIDINSGSCSEQRAFFYSTDKVNEYLSSLAPLPYSYSCDPNPDVPLLRSQLIDAFQNAVQRITEFSDAAEYGCDYIFFLIDDNMIPFEQLSFLPHLKNRIKYNIQIDSRLLSGILSRKYFWDVAEIGSHIQVRRIPDHYERLHQKLLCFMYN